ncbi:SDR family oxidoreductase [Planomonospora venezuelensis]|uniref:NAD(P)-dependent dehydrogenase (Short-subunit alcohol dehydrogenase family) n=1 Tax=Planomonospora venezuelensis TaxID=1999 RepID=A0A841CYR8_PLAVE|nr:SDR family oxidoreductase [Planomonospora venezuelensis]MBB5961137.1 NAD(P)-dependent dehydrogenase (short-subunit alcohol dehydrogenase family) [Planomonospora venezuelensis]GIM99807.1 short-chain dehydrogenase [Planomonospora venezuelensis]
MTKTALITGASRGLGLALARSLATRGWRLILTARGADALKPAADELGALALAGDVADPAHQDRLARAVRDHGGLDLLVNNASGLGAVPLPPLASYPLDVLADLFRTNVLAPLALVQAVLPDLRERGGAVVNISSDAATGAYEGWGGYGATKAALDQISHILAAEEPEVAVWWVDPGEMDTAMLADAVGAEEAAAAPGPETVVPTLLRLIETRPASGRVSHP